MNRLSTNLQIAVGRMRLIGVDARRYEVATARTELTERMEETLCAFANRDGGTIILGLDVADHFRPIVDFKPEAVGQDLRRVAEELTPACRLEIKRCPFEGAEVVVAFVAAAPLDQRPCFITRKGCWSGTFVRTAGGNRRLAEYEIARLQEFRRQPSFDREPVREATVKDLDAAILDAIVERNRKISPRVFGKMDRMEILTKLGGVVQDPEGAEGLKPTLAGLFAAGIYPQEFFPRLNVAFTVYPGVADGAAGCARTPKTQSVNGSIPEMLERSLELLEACMKEGAGSGNVVADYPLAACREALVNALQHRDYSPAARSSPVQINLFADRLEIFSPGGLFGAASAGSLPRGISITRNAALSQLLEYTPAVGVAAGDAGGVVQNHGTGLEQIKLQQARRPEAKLQDFVSAFQVTFFKRRLSEDERSGKKWTNFEAELLSELQKAGSLSVPEIMQRSGFSRNTVCVKVHELKESGLIESTEKARSPKQRYRLTGEESAAGIAKEVP